MNKLILIPVLTVAIFGVSLAIRQVMRLFFASRTGASAPDGLKNAFLSKQAAHEDQLAKRIAAGEDRYFEELRSLQAYPPVPLAAQDSKSARSLWNLLHVAIMSLVISVLIACSFG